jgi:hypothetical protein
MYSVTTGGSNVAAGNSALFSNTSGSSNVAIGKYALQSNTVGQRNTGIGFRALSTNITGEYNTAVGFDALYGVDANYNTALGYQAGNNITSGTNNLALGYQAAASSSTVSNEVTIGNTSITKFRVPGVGFEVDGTTSADNLKFNSGYGSSATAYGCRAWVNFNGQGTVAIRASGNVSSITDHGTGNYTVNFTNAMPDDDYAVALSAKQRDLNGGAASTAATLRDSTIASDYTTALVGVQFPNTSFNGFIDPVIMNVTVFR